MPQNRVPRALTIAGSDSGGGAGIQADLKTFAALGVYGTSAITAVTAQNTLGVRDALELPVPLIEAQIDAIADDMGADAVKTGMLASSEIIRAVAGRLEARGMRSVVVDPVMVAKGGARLIRADAVDALRDVLIPMARVVTPNAPEAETLVGFPISSLDDAQRAARALVEELGASAAIVKGGHLDGADAADIMYENGVIVNLVRERVPTENTHGTGCTFAAAVAAGLAGGMSLIHAAARAKHYVTEAIIHNFPMGAGHGPLNHFYDSWGEGEGEG